MISSVQDYPVSHYFNPDAAQRFFIPKYQREYVWKPKDFIGYRNGLYLNADLASRDDWNEAAITARTDKMLKEVKSILSLRENT